MNVFGFRLFYGWFVLLGLFVIYGISNGIPNFTLPLFYPFFMDEFGWNQAEVTRPAALKFAFASIFNLFVGYLIDRYASRPIMAVGAVLMVCALTGYVFMSELWHYTSIYLLLSFGLSMCGLVPCMLITGRWFKKYRGRAVGILLMASSFAGTVLPLAVRDSLTDGVWRNGMATLAIVGFLFMVLPIIWPVRSHPAAVGERQDGLSATEHPSEQSQLGIFGNVTLLQAIRMPVFYLLLIATGIMWFCISGMLQHQGIYLGKDQGIPPGQLANVFFYFFLCSIFGKFIFGLLSDWFPKGYIMLLAMLNLTVGLLILRFIEGAEIEMVYLYAIVYGIGFSGTFTMIQLTVAELFLGPTYGRILGVFVAVDNLGAAIGIFVLGQIRVAAESYDPAISLMIVLAIVAIFCVTRVNVIAKRDHIRVPSN